MRFVDQLILISYRSKDDGSSPGVDLDLKTHTGFQTQFTAYFLWKFYLIMMF